MFTSKFAKDTSERVIVTIAEFLLVLGGADGAGFLNLRWEHVVTLALFGGLAALLKSIIATRTGDSRSASFVGSELESK